MDILDAPGPGHLELLRLERADGVFHAAFCLARPSWPALRDTRGQFLHPEERDYFSTLKFERRQISYLTGRSCAKQALLRMRPGLSPAAIAIRAGVFHYPVVHGAGENAQVSISHAGGWGAAVAFPEEHPMSVDIEEMKEERSTVMRSQVTDTESGLVAPLAGGDLRALTLLWTVKEAMAKVIRCGMMTPFSMFEIASAKPQGGAIVCTFANFAQYKATCFFAEGLAVSLVSPKNSSFTSTLPARLDG